jgi:hypothetical protein
LSGKQLRFKEILMKKNLNSKTRKIIRWGCSIPLFALGLLYLNSAAFSFWAAGGPPTPNPEQWIMRGNYHVGIAVALILISIGIIWLFRPKAWENVTI